MQGGMPSCHASSRSPAQCSGKSLDKLQNFPLLPVRESFFQRWQHSAPSSRDFGMVSPREWEAGGRGQAVLQLLVVGSVQALSTWGRLRSSWITDVTAFLRDGGRAAHKAQDLGAGEAIQEQSYLMYMEVKDTHLKMYTHICAHSLVIPQEQKAGACLHELYPSLPVTEVSSPLAGHSHVDQHSEPTPSNSADDRRRQPKPKHMFE